MLPRLNQNEYNIILIGHILSTLYEFVRLGYWEDHRTLCRRGRWSMNNRETQCLWESVYHSTVIEYPTVEEQMRVYPGQTPHLLEIQIVSHTQHILV